MKRIIGPLLVIILSLGLFWITLAQPLSITLKRWTVDSGGGLVTGGNFELAGTIGQPDAGRTMTGADYRLTGGFWQPAPTPDRLLVLYALALDNSSVSNGNLASYYPDVVDALITATAADSSKIAVLLVDLDGDGDTHILRIANGQRQLLTGLPDASTQCETLTTSKREFDMTDGKQLGCFIKWARHAFVATKSSFSYVGHGMALAPAVDKLYNIVTSNSEQFTTSVTEGADPFPPVPTYKAVNPDWTDHHRGEDRPDPALITPYALAVALQEGTDHGNNPLDVVDLTHCFAVTIEEFYELSNPELPDKPYARVMLGSPNYTYFAPELLSAFLAAPQLEQDSKEMAASIITAYEEVFDEADRTDVNDPVVDDVDHPRVMAAVESSMVPAIKQAVDSLVALLFSDNNFNKDLIENVYIDSIHYDTTFCEGEWELAPPDALSDLYSFALQLEGHREVAPEVQEAARQLREAVSRSVIARMVVDGKPWFADIDPLPEWMFGDPDHVSGIALYTDFQGVLKDDQGTQLPFLSFQSTWYTDTVHPDHPQVPYAFTMGVGRNWTDVFARYWQGVNVKTEFCLPEFPPLQSEAELSVERIIFPLRQPGMVSVGSPTQLSAAIHTENVAPNPLVEFVVSDSAGNTIFSSEVSAGYLITGTRQVNASAFWVPDPSLINQTFTVTVRVDPNHERFIDPVPGNNTMVQGYNFPVVGSFDRPVITVINNSGPWISGDEISLTIQQTTGDTIEDVEIQVYEYEPSSPNLQAARENHPSKVIGDVELGVPFTVPLADLGLIGEDGQRKHGPVELHIWGKRGGNFSVAVPVPVKFNYVPPNIPIQVAEEHYYLFEVEEVGERVYLELALSGGGDANMFVWDPLNLWNPTAWATSVGDDFIDFEAPIVGQYVLMVYGETVTQYTLTASEDIEQNLQARHQSVQPIFNSDPYVPQTRPTFLPPIPQLPGEALEPMLKEVRLKFTPDGETAFTLLAIGSNFVDGSFVEWEGTGKETIFVNEMTLAAEIPISDLITASSYKAEITVVNPGEVRSNSVILDFSNYTINSSLIRNGGFEKPITNIDWRVYHDRSTRDAPAIELQSVEGEVYEGDYAAQISIYEEGQDIHLLQIQNRLNLGPLPLNTYYVLSFAARSNTGHDLSVYLHGNNCNRTRPDLVERRIELSADWQGFEFVLQNSADRNLGSACLIFELAPYAAKEDIYWIDDVWLVKIAVP